MNVFVWNCCFAWETTQQGKNGNPNIETSLRLRGGAVSSLTTAQCRQPPVWVRRQNFSFQRGSFVHDYLTKTCAD